VQCALVLHHKVFFYAFYASIAPEFGGFRFSFSVCDDSAWLTSWVLGGWGGGAIDIPHALDATRSTFSWNFQHALLRSHGPSRLFQTRHAILGVQPLSEKGFTVYKMIWKRFWDDFVNSFTVAFRPVFFNMDFGYFGFEDGHDGFDRAHMRLVSRHPIRRWFKDMFKAPFTSFHVVRRRRTSGPVRISIYI